MPLIFCSLNVIQGRPLSHHKSDSINFFKEQVAEKGRRAGDLLELYSYMDVDGMASAKTSTTIDDDYMCVAIHYTIHYIVLQYLTSVFIRKKYTFSMDSFFVTFLFGVLPFFFFFLWFFSIPREWKGIDRLLRFLPFRCFKMAIVISIGEQRKNKST